MILVGYSDYTKFMQEEGVHDLKLDENIELTHLLQNDQKDICYITAKSKYYHEPIKHPSHFHPIHPKHIVKTKFHVIKNENIRLGHEPLRIVITRKQPYFFGLRTHTIPIRAYALDYFHGKSPTNSTPTILLKYNKKICFIF